MTTEQKHNISRGVKLARQRKRRSDAMKASWVRRRTNSNNTLPNRNDLIFGQIEQLALTWKGLEAQKWQVSSTPRLVSIIQGAIDRIRLEIILACRTYLNERSHN